MSATGRGRTVVHVESLETEDSRTYSIVATHVAPATDRDGRRAEALRRLNDAARSGPIASDTADERRRAAQTAIEVLREIGDQAHESMALAMLASIDADAGRSREAAIALDQALALARQAGDAAAEADLLVRLGRLQVATGQPREAEQTLTAALAAA